METKVNSNTKRTTIKVSLVAAISLLLLIPLTMIKGVIEDRENAKEKVTQDVVNSYADAQIIYAPWLVSSNATLPASMRENKAECVELDYKAEVETNLLTRSVYDVIVYNAKVKISGSFRVTDEAVNASYNKFMIVLTDFKGLSDLPQLTFGDKNYNLVKEDGALQANVELPKDITVGELVDFEVNMGVKGTESLMFDPRADETTLSINSAYPHPSFQGAFLPEHREVRADGFCASWRVLDVNIIGAENKMGVKFVDPANPYQQSMRSVKYGMLIIVLVFVAGLFVEFLTKKEINPIQYAVIGLSLVLFYSLLVAFSEFMTFGVAYIIAALMTTGALMFYFRAILKSRSAYVLGGFVAVVYALNYMLLQMETYALLAGSVVLFLLLCVVMYLTANINNNKELAKTE